MNYLRFRGHIELGSGTNRECIVVFAGLGRQPGGSWPGSPAVGYLRGTPCRTTCCSAPRSQSPRLSGSTKALIACPFCRLPYCMVHQGRGYNCTSTSDWNQTWAEMNSSLANLDQSGFIQECICNGLCNLSGFQEQVWQRACNEASQTVRHCSS